MRPFRLVMLAALGLLIYAVFFAAPQSVDGELFDPAEVAEHEVALWQATRAGQEYGVYLSVMMHERALNRYTWFRAAQVAFYLGRATQDFVGIDRRFERVLPAFEAAAAVERNWRDASFEPTEVARARLNWWIARKQPGSNNLEYVADRLAEEYALRYGISAGRAMEPASLRGEAVLACDRSGVDPDWPALTRMLTASYAALERAMRDTRTASADGM